MNRETQINILDNLSKERRELMLKKSGDYASDDVLDNFKKAGSISRITPEQQCLSLISTKVARLGNLLKQNNTPNNESISDSVIDLINYSELLYCLLKENAISENETIKKFTQADFYEKLPEIKYAKKISYGGFVWGLKYFKDEFISLEHDGICDYRHYPIAYEDFYNSYIKGEIIIHGIA